jgi:hypothetical protein
MVCTCFHTGFLHSLFFYPEDGAICSSKTLVDFQWTTRWYILGDKYSFKMDEIILFIYSLFHGVQLLGCAVMIQNPKAKLWVVVGEILVIWNR